MVEMQIPEGYKKVGPKTKDTAIKLFALADKLDLGPKVIKSQNDGFLVPEEVAKELEGLDKPKKKARTRKAKEEVEPEADNTKEGND